MLDRIMRIVKLDFSVFKEIESDPSATTQAAIIVAVASVLSAVGSAVGAQNPGTSFLSEILTGLIGWVVWAYVSYFVGRVLFQSKGTFNNMLRVVGYANAPRLLGILGIIPCVGWIGSLAGAVLALIAGVLAVREGLDLDNTKAIIVTVIGWAALMILGMIIAGIFGVGAAFMGAAARG
jgi:hypothetical protein